MKPILVFMLSALTATSCSQKERETVSKKEVALSVIYNRKSVRSYTSQI